MGMVEYLHMGTQWIANVAELFAAIIIGIAVIKAFFKHVTTYVKKPIEKKEPIRIALGRSLTLGLEFLLAADILKTVVDPNWHDLGILAVIVVLRTALNYFLDKELENHEKRFGEVERSDKV